MKKLRRRLAILLTVLIFSTLAFSFSAQAFTQYYMGGEFYLGIRDELYFRQDRGEYINGGRPFYLKVQADGLFNYSGGIRSTSNSYNHTYRSSYASYIYIRNTAPINGYYQTWVRNTTGPSRNLDWVYIYY